MHLHERLTYFNLKTSNLEILLISIEEISFDHFEIKSWNFRKSNKLLLKATNKMFSSCQASSWHKNFKFMKFNNFQAKTFNSAKFSLFSPGTQKFFRWIISESKHTNSLSERKFKQSLWVAEILLIFTINLFLYLSLLFCRWKFFSSFENFMMETFHWKDKKLLFNARYSFAKTITSGNFRNL